MQINCSATQTAFRNTATVEQAAVHLGCSARRVRTLLAEKRLSGERVGKSWVVEWPLRYTLASRGPLLKVASVYRIRPKTTRKVGSKKPAPSNPAPNIEKFDLYSRLKHNVSHCHPVKPK